MKFLSSLMLGMFMLTACSCGANMPNRVSYMENTAQLRAMQDATAGLVDENGLYCAGAFISQNEVVSAAHCVQTQPEMNIRVDENGNIFLEFTEASTLENVSIVTRTEYSASRAQAIENASVFDVILVDSERDLVFLRAHDVYEAPHATLRVPDHNTQSRLTIGDSTYAVGHPGGVGWNISHGFLSRDPLIEQGTEYLISSSEIFFGNSGGPLMDSQNNLIGICHGFPGSPNGVALHVGMFVSPNEIATFLDAVHESEL